MNDRKSQHDKRLAWSGKLGALEDVSLSPVVTASAALLCITLTQYLSSKQAEFYSEIICWSLLPALFHITQPEDSPRTITPPNSVARQPSSWKSTWVIALWITLATLYRAELGNIKLYVKHAYNDILVPD